MARYFSEQTLLEMRDKDMNYVYDLTDLEQYLAGVPTADVVPKSEVERFFEEIDKLVADLQLDRYLAKRGFDGILMDERSVAQRLAELKKKYTGEEQ